MKKAGSKADSTAALSEEFQMASNMAQARQLFISEVFGLSWRLALTVLVPLIGGIKLDDRFGSEPLYTLLGLGLAFVLGSATVWTAVQRVNRLQTDNDNGNNKEK